MSKKRKAPKRKRKVRLPVDATGEPIQIDDLLQWPDGERLKVETLTYVGGPLDMGWMAEGPGGADEYSDNLGAATIIARGMA